MKKIFFCFLLVIGAFLIGSCSSRIDRGAEKLPGVNIPINKMNAKIRLEPAPGIPEVHKSGEALGFMIRNQSSDTISFDHDFGIMVFKKQGASWEPVENNWGYPEGDNILPTAKESPVGLAFFLSPNLEDLKASTTVRIVVIGHVIGNPKDQVGAYFDVQYEPLLPEAHS